MNDMSSIILDNPNKPLMIAHRGLSGVKLENTKEAFELASNHTYFGIETDVHSTKDNRIVVCHDGRIYMYSAQEYISEDYYNLTVVEYLKQGYNEDEAQRLALQEIQEKFDIQIKEVTDVV